MISHYCNEKISINVQANDFNFFYMFRFHSIFNTVPSRESHDNKLVVERSQTIFKLRNPIFYDMLIL